MQKTLTALLWNFTGLLGNQVVQFLITLVMARMLAPDQFALISMLTVFTAIATSIIESGYGSALIQKQTVTRIDESSVFYFNLVAATCLYGIFWYLAIPIASFYHAPELTQITRLLALNFILNAFGLVQNCLLTKQLDFRTQGKATMIASSLSGIIGIVMALHGYGVYSLVWQSLCNNLIRSSLLWVFSSWRPLWAYSHTSMRTMFFYGSRLLMSGLLSTLYENLYPLLIGKLFPRAELGYYTRAQLSQRLASNSLTQIVINVSFPAYSSIQHDRVLFREGYRKSIIYTSIIVLPLMLGLSAMAKPLFLTLFTAKWLPSVPYFQVFCLSGALYHLHALNLNVLKASGRSDWYFRLTVIKIAVAAAGALIAYRFGVMGIVWGHVVISCVVLFINTWYTGKIIDYWLRDQVRDIWPYVMLSIVSAVLVNVISHHLHGLHDALQVVTLVIIQITSYLGLARLMHVQGPWELLDRLRAHLRGTGREATIPAANE